MKWLPLFLLNLLFDIVAYVTSWLVPFFADDKGLVPNWLRWWVAFDHPSIDCDDEWNYEKWPLVMKLPAGWLRKYLLRCCWLYRNTGYTFAYEVCGVDTYSMLMSWKGDPNISNLRVGECPAKSGWCFIWQRDYNANMGHNLWNRPWCLYIVWQYGSLPVCFRLYLGWKLMGLQGGRHMLANYINPFMRFQVKQ